MTHRIIAMLLLALLLGPASASAAPVLIPVRAVALDDGQTLVTWQPPPGAALSCVTTYAGGVCLVGAAPGRLLVRAAYGEPISLLIQSEAAIIALGATSAGPPPIYLPAVEVSR
jgi:hypothetical protein